MGTETESRKSDRIAELLNCGGALARRQRQDVVGFSALRKNSTGPAF
jgi:hypothetical protein